MDIRKQWERLMVIASRMLGYDLEGKRRMFFNFRHTGASHIAQRGKTPAHLLAVVQIMWDTSVATVNRHYFKMEPDLMRELVLGWSRPNIDLASSPPPIFSAPTMAVFARHRSLSQASARPGMKMPRPRSQFAHRYTTVHLSRGRKPVPFVSVSGRWLEAFGFKEGARFVAVGVEGGLLVLSVYEAAPSRLASLRVASQLSDGGGDQLAPSNAE